MGKKQVRLWNEDIGDYTAEIETTNWIPIIVLTLGVVATSIYGVVKFSGNESNTTAVENSDEPNLPTENNSIAYQKNLDYLLKDRGYTKIDENKKIIAKGTQEYYKVMRMDYYPAEERSRISVTYGLINADTKFEEVPLGIYNYISDDTVIYNNITYRQVQTVAGETGLLSMEDFSYIPNYVLDNENQKTKKLTNTNVNR